MGGADYPISHRASEPQARGPSREETEAARRRNIQVLACLCEGERRVPRHGGILVDPHWRGVGPRRDINEAADDLMDALLLCFDVRVRPTVLILDEE